MILTSDRFTITTTSTTTVIIITTIIIIIIIIISVLTLPPVPGQVYSRIKAPLLTLMAGGNPEVEYCILKHMAHMAHKCPGVFDDEYRQVRY
jgi:hypothetical protein